MDFRTRRQFLVSAAIATGGLAGCLGSETTTSRSSSGTEGPGRTIPEEQTATDPPMVTRRADGDQPPIRLADASADEGDTETDSDGEGFRDHVRHPQYKLIDSASTAERLVEDTPADSSDTTDLASFVSSTEFDNESLYLETRQVEQCFRLSLCYISWQSNEIRTDYGRVVRPYDEQCETDVTALESRLIRLPVALDAEETNGYGSSTRSGRCLRARRRANRDRTNQSTESRPPVNNSSQSPNGSEST